MRGLRAAGPAPGPDGGDPAVAEHPLAAALASAVRGFRARQQAVGEPVDAELTVVGEPVPVGEAVETALVRAAQSSLANVAQHARARRCRVTLTWLDGEVALDVADDGAGAVGCTSTAGGTGVGLAGLRERVAGVGGEVSVESAPGEGTVVAVRVPLGRAGGGNAQSGSDVERSRP